MVDFRSIFGKVKPAAKILPIFAKENVSDFANQIMREDEQIRNLVLRNPQYKFLLEKNISDAFKKYRGVLTGSKLVDSWDRVTSTVGLIADAVGPATGGAGNVISAVEEVPELIPKSVYALYYVAKTGDVKTIPLWAGLELLSFIPYLGDAIDMSNIYVNRARKIVKEKAKKNFVRDITSGKLEGIVS